jgi:hypothetical protein
VESALADSRTWLVRQSTLLTKSNVLSPCRYCFMNHSRLIQVSLIHRCLFSASLLLYHLHATFTFFTHHALSLLRICFIMNTFHLIVKGDVFCCNPSHGSPKTHQLHKSHPINIAILNHSHQPTAPHTNHTPTPHKSHTNHTQVTHQSLTLHKSHHNPTPITHQSHTNYTPITHQPHTNHTSITHQSLTLHQSHHNPTPTTHQPHTNHTSITHSS